MDQRNATIHVTEYGPQTAISVNANKPIEFVLTIIPQKFPDPRVAELERVVESQRQEILTALTLNDNLSEELAEANRAPKKRPRRRR